MAPGKKKEQDKGFSVNDRRWWLRDDVENMDIPEQPESKLPTFVEDLKARLEEKDRLLQEYIQAHKSSVSDMDEARVRLEKDLQRRLDIENARESEPFLEVQDNLQRLLDSCNSGVAHADLGKGIELTIRHLGDLLAKLGLEPVPTRGAQFDPRTMEALITTEVDEDQDGLVLEEVRPGYLLKEHVVRPAGVRVGVAKRS
jgi:molecular chaperone GrpE